MLGRTGGVLHSDKVWMSIVDRQLFPILSCIWEPLMGLGEK